MEHLILTSSSPYFNLAMEEYLLTKIDEEFFILWQNEPSIIIGCHQNAYAEVNLYEAELRNIKIARRITGGGAVYHDLGNLNFSLILNKCNVDTKMLYEMLCKPIVDTLEFYGLEAKFGGRNDLMVGDKKIAGCALRKYKNRVLVHGAMLYNADLQVLSSVLTPNSIKFDDKAVKSVSSRVSNVLSLLPKYVPLNDLKQKIILRAIEIFGGHQNLLSEPHIKNIYELSQKYSDKNWIFGKVLPSAFHKIGKTKAGNIEVFIDFKCDKINNIRICGDFFGEQDIAELERQLYDCEYDIQYIHNKLCKIDLNKYIYGIDAEELLGLMF
jgi:lipoate-protein ligase A